MEHPGIQRVAWRQALIEIRTKESNLRVWITWVRHGDDEHKSNDMQEDMVVVNGRNNKFNNEN